jgi:spore maturation protein CgeE
MGKENNKINHDIREIEKLYLSCFTERVKLDDVQRFTEQVLPDMYDHNISYLNKKVEVDSIIHQEISFRLAQNMNYCKVISDDLLKIPLELTDMKLCDPEHFGIYLYQAHEKPLVEIRRDCVIKKIEAPDMIEDLIRLDIETNSEFCGEDFCIRRSKRHGEVCLAGKGLHGYLCYLDGKPVGSCDIFLKDEFAKIEDFFVVKELQHQKIGTAILMTMIQNAVRLRARHIYLTTDEDDTVKEMYIRYGFTKIMDTYGLLFKQGEKHV